VSRATECSERLSASAIRAKVMAKEMADESIIFTEDTVVTHCRSSALSTASWFFKFQTLPRISRSEGRSRRGRAFPCTSRKKHLRFSIFLTTASWSLLRVSGLRASRGRLWHHNDNSLQASPLWVRHPAVSVRAWPGKLVLELLAALQILALKRGAAGEAPNHVHNVARVYPFNCIANSNSDLRRSNSRLTYITHI
jgi:hypothetical protein